MKFKDREILYPFLSLNRQDNESYIHSIIEHEFKAHLKIKELTHELYDKVLFKYQKFEKQRISITLIEKDFSLFSIDGLTVDDETIKRVFGENEMKIKNFNLNRAIAINDEALKNDKEMQKIKKETEFFLKGKLKTFHPPYFNYYKRDYVFIDNVQDLDLSNLFRRIFYQFLKRFDDKLYHSIHIVNSESKYIEIGTFVELRDLNNRPRKIHNPIFQIPIKTIKSSNILKEDIYNVFISFMDLIIKTEHLLMKHGYVKKDEDQSAQIQENLQRFYERRGYKRGVNQTIKKE